MFKRELQTGSPSPSCIASANPGSSLTSLVSSLSVSTEDSQRTDTETYEDGFNSPSSTSSSYGTFPDLTDTEVSSSFDMSSDLGRETAYTKALQEILTRYHNYTMAKSLGTLGTSPVVLNELQHLCVDRLTAEKEERCSLCLEKINEGDVLLKLPCGHLFHSGDRDQTRRFSKGITETNCKGVLHWLENKTSCPQCRSTLPPKFPKPSKSEVIMVPLLHRQYKVIQKKNNVIASQRREIEFLRQQLLTSQSLKIGSKRGKSLKKFEQRKRIIVSDNSIHEAFSGSNTSNIKPFETVNLKDRLLCFSLPRPSWQDYDAHSHIRVSVLSKVTEILLNAANTPELINDSEKHERFYNFAAKIEVFLYNSSASFEIYSDISTLKHRTVTTMRNLLERAKMILRPEGEVKLPLNTV